VNQWELTEKEEIALPRCGQDGIPEPRAVASAAQRKMVEYQKPKLGAAFRAQLWWCEMCEALGVEP
jgi:hypothetical protein